MFFIYTFLFIFGLLVGSFLNVVSLRYLPGNRLLDLKIINGRSKCLSCRKKLVWYELIPILSFIIQRGRCRACSKRLSLQYPVVEFLSGLIFLLVSIKILNFQLLIFNFQLLVVIVWIAIFLLFLLLSVIDFRRYIIPDQINLSLAFLGVILVLLSLLTINGQQSFLGHYAYLFGSISLFEITWFNHFFAALLAVIFFWLIIFFSRGKAMGWGDLKLAGALGLIFGWPDIIMTLMLSFLIGGIFSSVLLIKGKKKMKDAVPFGPFLVIGSALTFFLGFQIIDWYFKLFGIQ